MTPKPLLNPKVPKLEVMRERKYQPIEIHYHIPRPVDDVNRENLIKNVIICISLILLGFFLGVFF